MWTARVGAGRSMRVLFILPDLSPDAVRYGGAISYGVASLAACLRQRGHEPLLYHFTSPPREEEFRHRVLAARPDVIGFSINSHDARCVRTWCRWAKTAARVPLVVGGIHATLAPEEVSALEDVDFTGIGEADQALPELCDALAGWPGAVAGADPQEADPHRVRGFWARSGSALVRNGPCPPPEDLDALPDPDLSLFQLPRLDLVRQGIFPYLMSRGCGWRCAYCSTPALRRLHGGGRYWRFLSPERATRQLASLLARHMPKPAQVRFLDTVLFARLDWLEEFAELYRRRVGRPFSCNLRADIVTPDVARILSVAGCDEVRLGVESGDPQLTLDVLRRGVTAAEIRRAFALLGRAGIACHSSNMVGLPGENLRKALATVRLNAELRPRSVDAFLFRPYPQSDLHRLSAERGWLVAGRRDRDGMGAFVGVPGFPEGDVLFVHRFFRRLVRLYALGGQRSPRLQRRWHACLDAVFASPLLPRGAIVRCWNGCRQLRRALGGQFRARGRLLRDLLRHPEPIPPAAEQSR